MILWFMTILYLYLIIHTNFYEIKNNWKIKTLVILCSRFMVVCDILLLFYMEARIYTKVYTHPKYHNFFKTQKK